VLAADPIPDVAGAVLFVAPASDLPDDDVAVDDRECDELWVGQDATEVLAERGLVTGRERRHLVRLWVVLIREQGRDVRLADLTEFDGHGSDRLRAEERHGLGHPPSARPCPAGEAFQLEGLAHRFIISPGRRIRFVRLSARS
jgi:hypothetical protein